MDPSGRDSATLPRNQGAKACTNCARIKCKCVPIDGSTSCERCHRLNKTCIPSVVAQRRGPKRQNAASRSARLEEKLDDLVSLLKARNSPVGSILERARIDDPEANHDIVDEDPSPSSTTLTSNVIPFEVYDCNLSSVEAEEALQRFRDNMMTFPAFVYIPPDATSSQLRQSHPFLWLNIMSVTASSVKMRQSLCRQARDIIVQKVVAQSERSLDLLLGLLTFVNWVHLFPMDLATVSVWDLELQAPPPECSPRFPPAISIPGVPQPLSRKERTMEERRAVLGTFVITSTLVLPFHYLMFSLETMPESLLIDQPTSISYSFKAADGLRWTTYFDEYLDYLDVNSDVAQDKLLISQVKMQLIVNQVRSALRSSRNVIIPSLYVDALRGQLDGVAGTVYGVGAVADTNPMIHGLYHFTTLIIHESSLNNASIASHEPDFKRFEVYQRCMASIKAWFDRFFSIPAEMYASMPCSSFCQLFYVTVCLLKLSMIKDSAWDPAAAQNVVDPTATLDKILHTIELLIAAAAVRSPEDQEDAALSLGIRKFSALRSAWQSELAYRDRENYASQEPGMSDGAQDLFVTSPLGFFGFDLLPGMSGDLSWL